MNKSEDLLPGWNLKLLASNIGMAGPKNNTQEHNLSTARLTINKMTEMKDQGAVVFIGPDKTCASEALVAAAWNMPMISYVSTDGLLVPD